MRALVINYEKKDGSYVYDIVRVPEDVTKEIAEKMIEGGIAYWEKENK